MKTLYYLTKRNTKLVFKDKGMLFTSLITPLILLVLYATFLANVYRDAFLQSLPAGIVSDEAISALVGGQLVSSLLAVSAVTVAFCSNLLMVQDRANGVVKDIMISPVKSHIVSLSYYFSTLIATTLICLLTVGLSFIYLACIGFYLSVADVFLLLLDVCLLVIFGTALASVVNFFLTSQGQMSAVGSIVSSCYGFVCGAYMPISQLSEPIQRAIMFLPGTYATSLLRNHCMRGALSVMQNEGIPSEVIEILKDGCDANIYFFGDKVEFSSMYIFLAASCAVLIGIFVLMNVLNKKSK